MRFFYVEPEVAGELGDDTVVDASVHPPAVSHLHYRFSGWLGDGIVESFPCFIATDAACEALRGAGITGTGFADMKMSVSDDFAELYPGRTLPRFEWLRISGVAGVDDLGIAADYRLVASERAIEVLRRFGLDHAELEDYA